MNDDAQLLREYVEEQSEAAFTELVRRHLNLVYFSALRRLDGDAHEAKDVAQGVFVLLARKASSLHRHPSLAGWLHSAAIKKASEAIRAGGRRRMRERQAHLRLEQLSDPTTTANWELIRPVLDEAILKLNNVDREVVLLRFFEKCAFSDVSAKLGLSENAAKKRIERALERLRTLLAKRGITSTTAALVEIFTAQAGFSTPAGIVSAVNAVAMTSAGASWSISSLLQLCSTTKLTLGMTGVIGLAGIASLGVATYALQTNSRMNASLEVAKQGYEVQLDQFRIAESNLKNADQDQRELLKAIARSRSAETANGPQLARTIKRPNDSLAERRADGRRFLAAFPEAREMLAAVCRAQIARDFTSFYKSAHLTPLQIDEFERLLQKTSAKNLAVTPESTWGDASPPSEQQLREILGDQSYHQYQDYSRILNARRFANDVATQMGGTVAPISPDEADQLAKIVASNTPPNSNRPALDLDSTDWDAVIDQSRAMLSDAQWTAIKGPLLYMEYRKALVSVPGFQAAAGEARGATVQ